MMKKLFTLIAILSVVALTFAQETVTTETGREWMDRNLGAENIGDYGDLYRFGIDDCPDGFRLPKTYEWEDEINAETLVELNLPFAGYSFGKSRVYAGYGGAYWTSDTFQIYGSFLDMTKRRTKMNNYYKYFRFSVRCIKD